MQNIKNINPKKATGYDNIPGKMIKMAYRELSVPICNLMNTCIAMTTFPTPFKFADVSPIFKSDDNMNKGNFRPVSILSILSKLFESVLNEQMLDHFREIFDALLSAYRRHYSCQTILLKFVEDVKSALDGGHKVGTIFMDLSKAFDCLPHGLLIAKLHAYGCSMSACELISNYLSNRQQCVKILNNRSTWRTLSKGVPQGSILGPLLFNVFMNDMFLFMKSCNFYNYADDNFVSRSSPDVNVILSNLKSDCQISLKWFDDNGMKANPSKFKFMIMSSENIEPQILTISDDVCLQSQTDVKVLGITVDYRLTFNEHIRICTLKAARQLNALSRISKYLDTKSKSVLYHSFIASNFNYCPIVWHFCGVVNNNKLEKIQERSLRILFSDYESDVHDLLDSIGGQTLALRRLKFKLLEVYKCIKKVNAPCLHNLFNTNTIPYQLRTSKLEQPLRRTTRYGLRTFSYVGSHLWNSVSNDHSDIAHIDFNEFRAFLNTWKGPDISRYAIPLLWWLQCCEWFLCWCLSCIGYLYWYFYCKFTCIFLSYDCIFSHSTVYIGTLYM